MNPIETPEPLGRGSTGQPLTRGAYGPSVLGRAGITAPAVLFILCWLFLIAVDSTWGSYIPKASFVRLVIPILFVVAACSAKRSGKLATSAAVVVSLWVFIGVACLSVVVSVVPPLAAVKFIMYLCVMIPLLSPKIASHFSADSQGLWRLSQVALVIMAVCLVLLIKYPGGLMFSRNAAGGLTPLLVPLMLYNASLRPRKRRRLGRLGIGVCVLLAVVVHGRGSLLALFSTFLVYYVLAPGRSRSLRFMAAVSVGVMIIVLLVSSSNETVRGFVNKGEATEGLDIIDSTREEMFWEVIEGWKQRPVLGYGFGLSHRVQPEDLDVVLQTGRLSWITGELGSSTLGLLIGGGILLFLVFYGFMGVLFQQAMSFLSRVRRRSSSALLVRAMTAGGIGLLVSAQSENWLMAPLNFETPLFWLYCGIILFTLRQSAVNAARSKRFQSAG